MEIRSYFFKEYRLKQGAQKMGLVDLGLSRHKKATPIIHISDTINILCAPSRPIMPLLTLFNLLALLFFLNWEGRGRPTS